MALLQMSDFLENELLDHVFRNEAYIAPTSVHIALFTSATGLEANNLANEVSGVGYARLEVGAATGRDFTVAVARSTENNEDWTFANPGAGGWGTIVAMAVMDAATTGEILMYCDLTVSRTIAENDDVIFSAGQIKFFFNETPDQISDYLAQELLDHVLKNAAYIAPATVYGGLWTADDGLSGNTQTSEVVVSVGYARQSIVFDVAVTGATANTASVTFGPNLTTNWGTVTHAAVLDTATLGEVLMTKALDSPAAVIVNDNVRYLAGSLDILFK